MGAKDRHRRNAGANHSICLSRRGILLFEEVDGPRRVSVYYFHCGVVERLCTKTRFMAGDIFELSVLMYDI